MTPKTTELTHDDPRLSAVLVACLEAMDNGQPIDRQELLARHPQFATELGRFLDDQGHVDRFAAPLRAVARGGRRKRLGLASCGCIGYICRRPFRDWDRLPSHSHAPRQPVPFH